jgi:hypothetical protein
LKLIALTAALALAVIAFAVPALADATVTVPPSASTTVINFPVGDWVGQIVPVLGEIIAASIGAIGLWLLRQLPAAIRSKISDAQIAQAEQLLIRAADYGLNTVAADVKGKTVSVDTGNKAAAVAVQYVVDHGPEKLVDFMGGPDAIAQKIIARLPISAAASASTAATVVTAPVAAAAAPAAAG